MRGGNIYKKTNKQKRRIVGRKFKRTLKKQQNKIKNMSIKKNKRTKTIKRRNNK